MNDTPETDTMYDNVWNPKVASDALVKMRALCRKLERQKNELEMENKRLSEEVGRLVKGIGERFSS